MGNDMKKLRRYEDDLNVSGTGVIVMGAWGCVKTITEVFLGQNNVFSFLESDNETLATIVLGIVFAVVMILIILSVIMLVHIYIGRNAIKASKGLKHSNAYLVWTVIMLLLTIAGLALYKDGFNDVEHIDTSIASIFVDLTTVYIFAAVLRSAYMIKKLREKQMQE